MIKIDGKEISAVYDVTREIEKIYKGTLQVYVALRKMIVSGVPPLTLLNCAETNLVNYKIYGNGTGIGSKTNNLMKYPYDYTTRTINGVDFTDNGDGTVTLNGTSTATITYNIETARTSVWDGVVGGETYTLSLTTNKSVSGVTLALNYFPTGSSSYKGWMSASRGNPKTTACPSDIAGIRSYFSIASGKTFDNVILKPKLELGTKATAFEPYNKYKIPIKVTNENGETRTTYVYIKGALKENDYIEYSTKQLVSDGVSTSVELPAVPLMKGKNTLEVETAIQPSNVEVVYKGSRIYYLSEEENEILNSILATDTETIKDISDAKIIEILDEIIGG